MCFLTRNAKLSKFINNENFCKKEKKEIDRSRDVTGMVDNMHSNLTRFWRSFFFSFFFAATLSARMTLIILPEWRWFLGSSYFASRGKIVFFFIKTNCLAKQVN